MNRKRGQSLIEVVVSVGIAVILAIALISSGLVANKTARSARNNTEATQLAEQYIEQIRVYRDRKGYSAISANNSCYIINTSSSDPASWTLASSGCPETVTLDTVAFSRSLTIADGASANTKLITATVTWNEPGGQQTVTSQTILSQWDTP